MPRKAKVRSNSSRKETRIDDSLRAGRSPEQFAQQAGIGRTTIYLLPDDAKPLHVRIGERLVIVEHPRDWLQRMRERGGVVTKRTKPETVAEATA